MSNGYSVDTGALSAGGKEVAGLVPEVAAAASGVAEAISGMAGSAAGHAGLAAALTSAGKTGSKAFTDFGSAYQGFSDGLGATASAYALAERVAVAHFSRLAGAK